MKKTLLALSVLAAGSAQAGINLYEADGITVDVSGAAEVQFFKDYDETQDAEIRLDDGDLEFLTTIEISPDLRVLGDIAFAFEDSDMTNDSLYVGLDGDFGTMTVGRQLMISDDQGNAKDYELADEAVSALVTEGDQVFKYIVDKGQFYGGVGAAFNENSSVETQVVNLTTGEITTVETSGEDTTAVDARIGVRLGDLDARFYYQTISDLVMDAGVDDVDTYNLEVDYVMGAVELAAGYSYADYDNETANSDVEAVHVAAGYTVGKTTFAGGYLYTDVDGGGNSDTVYANVTQKLHANVKAYAEVGYQDDSAKDTDVGYLVGMEVVF